ncbi:MAG TPA: DNA polymerase IV [Candidatus Polarisedimenticolia bacterium]|nr:DNA polymerase IV [Candidatus Polarisedimenticolia bacterium]
MERAIFHLDIPAFPVAVERVVAPRLVGRPVVVAPSSSTRAAIVVASLEARREGVYRGMSLARAVRICRDLIVLPPNAPLYRRASDAILKVLNGYSPLLEPAGAGHVFLDMTGTTRLFGRSVDSADRIQREVRQRLRLAATLGVASNKLVSRAAARVIRPGRLYDVFPGSEAPFLAPLDVDLLPGIDLPAREILSEVNIARVRELAALDIPHLRLLFGQRAWRLYREARGIDPSPVRPPEATPAVREEETLPEDSNEDAVQLEALDRLAARAAAQVRRMRLEAGCVRLRLCYADGVESAREERPKRPACGDLAVREVARRLFEAARGRRIQIRHLELTLAELRAATGQMSLFEEPAAVETKGDAPALGRDEAVSEREARAAFLAAAKQCCEGPVTGENEAIRHERRDSALTAALDRIRERFGGASVGFRRVARPVEG